MLRYLLRRLCYSILLLWGVATLVFLLFHVLPGDPARLTVGQRSDLAFVEAKRKALRLDKPLWTRYGLYLNDLSPIGLTKTNKSSEAPQGFHLTRVDDSSYLSLKAPNLGRSYGTKRPVSEVLWKALPGTIVLAFTAMLIASIIGIALGILAALKKGTVWDTGAIAASIAGISMPSFLIGLIIAYVFAYRGLHPALQNLIVPALALGIRPIAIITQLTRSAMLDILSQDYIRTAYAKGLNNTRVVLKHALPNALSPVVTASPGWVAELLAGAFFIEYIFGRKGIGKITIDALDKIDLPLVTGAVLLTALIFVLVNLLTDMLHGLLDPRVRLS